MYTPSRDAPVGAYEIPSNYGGTALASDPQGQPVEKEVAEINEAVEVSASAPASALPLPPPPSPPRRDGGLLGGLSRLFSRGGEGGGSDLILILIAFLLLGEDNEIELPLIILAILLLDR